MLKNKFLLLLTAISILGGILPKTLYAQPNIDSATREADRDMREQVQKELLPPAPKEAPIEETPEAGTEKKGPSFFLKKIELSGTESFPPEEFRDILDRYENRDVTLADLNILAKDIEKDYLDKGIIAACYVPPQEVKGGIVILQVVESHMGELELGKEHFYDANRLRYYWNIKSGEILRYDKMSEALYLMNKNPDRSVKATLHAGDNPRTTDVILDAKTRFPVHVTGSFDREGAVTSGRERKGIGLRHNNFLFVDDILLTGYNYGRNFFGSYFYHSIPITPFGTSVMYGYSYSKSAPHKEYTPMALVSRSENSSCFVHQDLFRKGGYIGEIYAGMDAKDKQTKTVDGTINRDRLRIIRIGGNFVYERAGSVTYLNPELSQGINGFGARPKGPLSSRGAGSTFTKFKLDVSHRVALPLNVQGVFSVSGQLASERLTPQEQFSLGGIDSVRGYPSGDFLADNALQANINILVPVFFVPENLKLPFDKRPLRDSLTGVLFFDYGYGEERGERYYERKNDSLSGIGAGLRVNLYNKAVFRLEWGWPIGDKPITEACTTGRFHFAIDMKI